MKAKPIILFITLFLCIGCRLQAQNPSCLFTHYSLDDGLSQNTVMSMAQDSKGILWLATWNGLNRFDGIRFKNYKLQWGSPTGLSNSRIDHVQPDRLGRIWGITYSHHVCLFNPLTESFTRIPVEGEEGADAFIHTICVLDKAVWFLSDEGGVGRSAITDIQSIPVTRWFPAAQVGRVRGVLSDTQGREWIYGDKGLFCLSADGKEEKLLYIEATANPTATTVATATTAATALVTSTETGPTTAPLPSVIAPRFTSALVTDHDLYLGSEEGALWHYDGQRLESMPLLGASSAVIALDESLQGRLMAVTARNGLYLCDLSKREQEAIPLPKTMNGEVFNAYVDAHDEVWIDQQTPGRIAHYDVAARQWLIETLVVEPTSTDRSRPAFHAHEDVNGTLWIHPYGGGFSYYDRTKRQLCPFFNSLTGGEWRFSNKIHSCLSDAQGNLWLCTHSKGVEKVTFLRNRFQLMVPEQLPYESLSNEVRALLEDSHGQIWAGCKDGHLRLYNRQKQYLGYLTEAGTVSRTGQPMRGNAYGLMEDKAHNLWIATKGDGLVKAQPLSEKLFRLSRYERREGDPYSLSHNDVYAVHEDSKGRIWVATYGGGINYFDPSTAANPRFHHAYNDLRRYPIEHCSKVRFVTDDGHGRIWIGTTLGALVAPEEFNTPESLPFTHIYNKEEEPQSLRNNDVHWIHRSSSDTLYLATFGGGLNKLLSLSPDGKATFRSYGTDQGLASDVVLAIREDATGHLWMSTESGLSRFTPSTEQFINYSEKEVGPHVRFSEAASCSSTWGSMLFGTSNGICSFYPDSTLRSDYVPTIVLSRLSIQGREVQPAPRSPVPVAPDGLNKLVLTHRDNLFSLEYAALDYTAPQQIQYAYIMEGFEKSWNYVGNRRTAIYTNLPKGKYLFKVRSTNADGVWTDNERVLPIEILPSFWETPFAYFLYVLFILLVIVAAVYILFTIYRLKHEVAVEQQVTDMKLRFFTDISHELRTPLTLIAGPVEHVLKNNQLPDDVRQQLEVVGRNTNRMLRLINQILDFRKIQNKKMKLQVQRLEAVEFARKLMGNFQAVADERGIDFQFESSQPQIFLYADVDKLEKIIFNLLSNAFKYTPDGKQILLFVRQAGEKVQIGVVDQGIGFDESHKRSIFLRFENLVDRKLFQQSTGIGLSLVKELVEMHKAEIEVDSKPGEGSRFTVTFLSGKSHFDPTTEFLQDDASVAQLHTKPQEATASAEEGKPTLLVIEDNGELRLFLHTIFGGDYQITEAENGQVGLEKAHNLQPDLIISDVMMPVMDGIEMLKRLRNEVATSHIPVVLLTAKTSVENQIEGLEYGADVYITKPFSASFLKARVKNLLAGRKLLQTTLLNRLMPASNEVIQPQEVASVAEANGEAPVVDAMSPQDRKFMDKLVALMEKNMDNGELLVDDLVQEMAVSRSVFFKKLKSLTGLAPVEFIKEVRINRAIELIKTGEYSMTQVAYMVGINDPRYFSKCFKAKMGMTPTEYREKLKTLTR